MEKEFVVETESGSLYRLDYKKNFFSHGTRFTLKQLFGKTIDFGSDDYIVFNFSDSKSTPETLDLKDLKIGSLIFFCDKNKKDISRTSRIVKIYERIQ